MLAHFGSIDFIKALAYTSASLDEGIPRYVKVSYLDDSVKFLNSSFNITLLFSSK